MSFETIAEFGDPIVGGKNVVIYVYPNEEEDRSDAEDLVIPALQESLDELVFDVFDKYEINLYEDEPEIDCEEDDDWYFFLVFDDWIRGDHNEKDGGDYIHRKEIHLGVFHHTNMAMPNL